MQTHFTDDAGKKFTATLTNNTLYLAVPGNPHIEKMKIPPAHRKKVRRAIKSPCFHSFAAAVDELEG